MTTGSAFVPTSEQQFALWTNGAVPNPGPLPQDERIRDDLWAVTVSFPNPYILYTLSYLILDAHGVPHIVDPGFDTEENWEHYRSALRTIGRSERDVGSITVTHAHPDHLGMADRFSRESGAPIILHAMELATAASEMETLDRWGSAVLDDWGVPGSRRSEFAMDVPISGSLTASHADRVIEDEATLDIPGWNLRVIHTPGHTAGHIVLHEADRGFLLTGDHVLPNMHPGLGLGVGTDANPLTDYLNSLARVRDLGADLEVLPGHGYRFRGLRDRVDDMIEHRDRRSREVLRVLQDDENASTWEVASQLTWTAGWENLKAMDLASALSQTSMHHRHVKR